MGEADLDQTISPVYKKYTNPATTFSRTMATCRSTCARGADQAEALALLAEVGGQIEVLLGDRLYSRNGDSLEVTVGETLRKQRATLAVAESATAGGLADRITSVPGASDYFVGGFITYTRAMKTEMLGVIRKCCSVSARSAGRSQRPWHGSPRRTGATYALSITGNAGPATDGDQAPVGMVYVGLASPSPVTSVHRQFLGDRARIRAFAAQMALDFLRRSLPALV